MASPDNIIDVTAADFDQVVIENSFSRPVLVDFWADWCGPCKMQLPVLQNIAKDYPDAVIIAKVNTDSERELAEQHGIRSLPTLRLYRNGEVVKELMGAQPESALRPLIESHMERASDQALQQALEKLQLGDRDAALQLLKTAYTDDPHNHRVAIFYARLCAENNDLGCAQDVLSGLPMDERDKADARALQALVELKQAVADAADIPSLQQRLSENPHDSEARYQLACRQALEGDVDAALDNLIELLRQNPGYADHAAKQGLLKLFDLLGSEDERVGQYRRKMFALLH